MKELKLTEGEELVFKVEGDIYGGGANPLTQALAKFTAFILKILGTKRKSTLVVTNKRVIMYSEVITCYCVPSSRNMNVIMPNSVMEVGYSRVTTCGCFPYYAFHFQGHTENATYPVKGSSEEDMLKYVEQFYNALTH